jgi:electron transfer flavoprotein beta subunit
MNILVCIKQVPDTTEIRIDPVTNTLIRDGVPSIVNTFDTYALELAARLKETHGGKVTVISMGPEQAKNALKECLAVGGDQAFLLSDRAFGGSDTLATSYVLSRAVAALEATEGMFDVIFCGKQAIDGDTAQVGPELAEHLGRGQATYIVDIVENLPDEILVRREADNGYQIVAVKKPAVLTVTKPNFEPRYATVRSKMAANRAAIPVLTSADIDIDLTRCGLRNSPTKVSKTFTPKMSKTCIPVTGDSPQAVAACLARHLSDIHLL